MRRWVPSVQKAMPRWPGSAEARRPLLERLLHPDRLAGRRIPGLDQADRVRRVGDAVDHQRRRAVGVVVAEIRNHVEDRLVDRRARPGDLQLIHVAGIDLVERRVLRRAVVGGVGAPLPVDRPLLGERGRDGAGQDENERTGHGADRNIAIAHHRFLQLQSGQMRIIGRCAHRPHRAPARGANRCPASSAPGSPVASRTQPAAGGRPPGIRLTMAL